MTRSLSAVLVEDDASRIDAFREAWEDILSHVFADVDVKVLRDIAEVDEIMRGRPHVIIVDNAFPDPHSKLDQPNRGLDFIVENKDKAPDCLFILYTGATFKVDALGNKFPNPDLVITKTSLRNVGYRKYISECISNRLSRLPVERVVFPDAQEAEVVSKFYNDLHSIIEQCILVAQNREDNDYVKQLNLERLGGGYSGSHVFLAKIFGPTRYQNVPFAFKLTEGTHVTSEVARYNHFVRLQLPHDMRVDLLGAGRTGAYSGALYAFAFGKRSGIVSATDQIRRSNVDFLELVSNRLFLSEDVGWYKNPRLEKTVEDFYSNSEEYAPKKDGKRLDGLRRNVYDIFGGGASISIDEDHYSIDGFRCEHVRRFLRKFFDKKMPESISHGDLNSNNIILSGAGDALSTIDFEYTGYDCFYKDFVSLESSIRTYWPSHKLEAPSDCWLTYEAERKLLAGSSVSDAVKDCEMLSSYFDAIARVREAARNSIAKTTVSYDENLYALSLAFHMLKLNGLGIWDKSCKVRLLACLLASCVHLQKLR